MTNQIIGPGKNEPEIQVDVGNGNLVSMQTVQHIYNEITGRTEELSRSYSINHCVTFDDIRQLNIKLCQLQEQYNIVSKNCAVTLYHLDDQKQVFSSFERFQLYDSTTLSPVENIRLEYKFLIILPQIQTPQSYEIEINIHSRASIIQRAKLESNLPSGFFISMFSEKTAHLEIKYIDYTVARNFQVTIDTWFKGLKQLPSLAWFRHVQALGEHFTFLLRLISITIFLRVCLTTFSPQLSTTPLSGRELYLAGTVTFGGVFLLSLIAGRIGAILANAVRRIRPLSYLKLTRGDENAFEQLKADNRIGWIKGALSIIISILVNIFSTWLAPKIGLGP